MNTNIRKDSKVSALINGTGRLINGTGRLIHGVVKSVSGDRIVVITNDNVEYECIRYSAVKLSAATYNKIKNDTIKDLVQTSVSKLSVPTVTNKKTICQQIFVSMLGMKRKEIISSFVSKGNISKAGASTYYQNFKSGHWVTS